MSIEPPREGPLAELQRAFQAFILEDASGIETRVLSTAALPVERRLRVYGFAYRIRLLGVLAEDYEKLRAWVGPETFAAWARGYLEGHPSTHPSLRWLGRRFAPYLAARGDVEPCHVEMARFEWAQGEVFDGPVGPTLSLEEVAAVPPSSWSAMRFRSHATLQRLDLAWNVPAIWRDLEDSDERRAAVRAAEPRAWVLWRRDLKTHWRSLPVEEATALDVALGGGDFGAICEVLLAWNDEDEVPARAAGFLKTWVTEGLLGSLDRDDEGDET